MPILRYNRKKEKKSPSNAKKIFVSIEKTNHQKIKAKLNYHQKKKKEHILRYFKSNQIKAKQYYYYYSKHPQASTKTSKERY